MNEVILPNGWSMTTLGEMADETVDRCGPAGSEFIYVDISSIDREQKSISDAKVIESATAPSRAKQVLQDGDVLISMTRPNLNAIALVTPEFHCAIGSTGFHVLRSKWVESKFLFYLVHTREFIEKMCLCVQGALYPAVRPNDIASIPFLLPSRPEQHRIVAKIEELFSELDKGIENLKTAQAQLKVYRQALLKHAIEGKLTAQWRAENQDKLETAAVLQQRIQQERTQRYQQQLADWQTNGGSKPKAPKSLPPLAAEELAELPELPEGWGWFKLADLSTVSGGLTKNPKRNALPIKRPFLRVGNVYANRLELSDMHETGISEAEIERVALVKGDLLVVEGNGSVDQIGRAAVWNGAIDGCVHQNHLIKARPLNVVRSEFILHFLMSELGRKFIVRSASSTSGLHTLSISKVESLFVPFCLKEEQEILLGELSSKLSLADQLDQTLTTSLQQAEALRQSILKKAFSGQLVPHDPHDEPASALLARIKAERVTVAAKPRKNISSKIAHAPD